MSTSSEDQPLGKRFGATDGSKARVAAPSDSDSSLPSWIKKAQSPLLNGPIVVSSDSDDETTAVQPAKKQKIQTANEKARNLQPAAGPSRQAQEPAGPSGSLPSAQPQGMPAFMPGFS